MMCSPTSLVLTPPTNSSRPAFFFPQRLLARARDSGRHFQVLENWSSKLSCKISENKCLGLCEPYVLHLLPQHSTPFSLFTIFFLLLFLFCFFFFPLKTWKNLSYFPAFSWIWSLDDSLLIQTLKDKILDFKLATKSIPLSVVGSLVLWLKTTTGKKSVCF